MQMSECLFLERSLIFKDSHAFLPTSIQLMLIKQHQVAKCISKHFFVLGTQVDIHTVLLLVTQQFILE